MNIGDVAGQTGLPAKTIRYCEEIGLIAPLRGNNCRRCVICCPCWCRPAMATSAPIARS